MFNHSKDQKISINGTFIAKFSNIWKITTKKLNETVKCEVHK